MNLAPYFERRYDLETSNCWHLLRDAWLELTGVDLGDRTPGTLSAAALIGRFDSDVPQFERLERPVSPSIVLMRRRGAIPHVGLFFRGRVLQMTQTGVSYLALDLAGLGFSTVEFYR